MRADEAREYHLLFKDYLFYVSAPWQIHLVLNADLLNLSVYNHNYRKVNRLPSGAVNQFSCPHDGVRVHFLEKKLE